MPARSRRPGSTVPDPAALGPSKPLLALVSAIETLTAEDAPTGVLREVRFHVAEDGEVTWDADVITRIGTTDAQGKDDHPWTTATSARRDHVLQAWQRTFNIEYMPTPATPAREAA